ncbi:hypothetical protein [Klebsiella aerogenes]|uniref:hypothetical protein n=1 Tax=Klebsiella aerogenes TaxID=548 RepID=UPI0002AAFECC|nr:hypothetical protein [Klebsiella aerogenes]AML36129.1 Hypothetical protein EAG7_02384 [Klebsiella aerogenes]CCG30859.1 hypothetical protein [Klebsiella aerogenes EA1509E]HBT2454343.1 hypothetical protein [Klebsiella aerogenes]HBT2461460.1 hypothetical protein [Klebsiella aerogenes]HBT2535687.1 hypothetical protein [Klebsiella aerogenes]
MTNNQLTDERLAQLIFLFDVAPKSKANADAREAMVELQERRKAEAAWRKFQGAKTAVSLDYVMESSKGKILGNPA